MPFVVPLSLRMAKRADRGNPLSMHRICLHHKYIERWRVSYDVPVNKYSVNVLLWSALFYLYSVGHDAYNVFGGSQLF